jgi:hypothetical protein
MNQKQIDKVVCSVAARYARRCWWVDKEDLQQVGWEAALKALRTWDPQVGVPAAAYLWRACSFAMRRYLWLESSPVSGGMNDPKRCRTQHRASLEHPAVVHLSDLTPPPDALLDEKRWTEEVLRGLIRLHDDDAVRTGMRVLFDEAPKEVALDTGLERASVYRSAAKARNEVAFDQDLWALARRKDTP